MTTIKIHSVVCIQSRVLVVFYTPGKCWQFRIISPDGTVVSDYPIYYSAVLKQQQKLDVIRFIKNGKAVNSFGGNCWEVQLSGPFAAAWV
ncbi:MAG: hypothetical protein V7L31_32240 [Nostoc sp.]|uniref:hypothetical protein n=1 Tax=Nostoc sp. TaxID=1180 RepID=UPI002FEFD4D4